MVINNIKPKFNQIRVQLCSFWRKINNDWSWTLSAIVAYYLLVSLIPLIICIFSAMILIFGDDNRILNITAARLEEAYPDEHFAEIINMLVDSVRQQASTALIVSFIVSMFTSTCLCTSIDDVLSIIYRIRQREVIKQYIHAIKMLVVFIIITAIIIILLSIPAFLKENRTVALCLTILFSGLLAFLLFLLIYYFVPQRQMSWSRIWCGSLIAAIGLLILFLLFPLYTQLFMSNYVGQFGFIIITLLFFYLFGLLLIIGAQINAYFFYRIEPLSTGLGNCICEFTNHENRLLIDENLQPNNNILTLDEGLTSQS